MGQAELNGVDIIGYGLAVISGLKNLEVPANPKPAESNSWPEQNGSEYILNSNVDDVDASLEMVLKADNMADFLTKKDAVYAIMDNGQFKELRVIATNRTYKVKYNKTSGFEFLNTFIGVAAKFTWELTIIKNLNQPIITTILDGNG